MIVSDMETSIQASGRFVKGEQHPQAGFTRPQVYLVHCRFRQHPQSVDVYRTSRNGVKLRCILEAYAKLIPVYDKFLKRIPDQQMLQIGNDRIALRNISIQQASHERSS